MNENIDISVQLSEQKRKVDFKTYDFSVKELISMINDGIINIAPDYQRKFRWDETRQSMLVESIFLGIPIPTIFMATNCDSSWEIIDGLQRISSIINFAADLESSARIKIGKNDFLKLTSLEKLTSLNGLTINDLPNSIKLDFLLKPLKIITLSDKSDDQVRFDLFQRLNTGGITLTDQEIRNCVYKGGFNDFIKRLSHDEQFLNVTFKPKSAKEDGTYQELVLRFFAYLFYRDNFRHNVKEFLNQFMEKASRDFDERKYENIFHKVFTQLNKLEYGICKDINRKLSPTVFWEAITVGAAEAILNGKEELNIEGFYNWVSDSEFDKLVVGATNSLPRIKKRIEFAQDKFSRL